MMRTSQRGRDLIKRQEGWRATVYQCESGHDTIGFGHRITAADKEIAGRRITKVQGEELLQRDIDRFELVVRRLVKVPLRQNQFDALIIFTFNAGEDALAQSTLLKKLNAGAGDAQIENELRRWVYVTDRETGRKKKSAVLMARREVEAQLWSSVDQAQ